MIESTEVRKWVTHVVLQLGHILFGGGFFGEGPRQHELGLEHRLRALHDSVEGGHHPRNCRMPDPALDVADPPAGVALVPGAVELLGGGPKLHDEIAEEVLRIRLASFFSPQTDQGRLIAAHNDAGVGAADETSAIQTPQRNWRGAEGAGHDTFQFSWLRSSSGALRLTATASL
jgi:hypothetical protein